MSKLNVCAFERARPGDQGMIAGCGVGVVGYDGSLNNITFIFYSFISGLRRTRPAQFRCGIFPDVDLD